MGASLTLVMPVNHEMDSVDQIQRVTDDQLGKDRAATSWSATPRTATASPLFESAEVRARLKDELGGREIT
jgi:hypothetical protein